MLKKIGKVTVNYEFHNLKSDTTIILLHGWGQNIEMMKPLGEKYQKYFNVLYLDLPGFGQSSEPDDAWDTLQYVSFLKNFIEELKLDKIILIGHSFGGRIALLYASLYQVEKLICLASPYCKELTKESWKVKVYKKLKNVPVLNIIANYIRKTNGSSDYNNATLIMRGVLVKAINTNLTEDVKKIKAPTLLIWGENDTAVPVKRAYELGNLIKDAGVIVYSGASHYAYLERLGEIINVIDSFLGVHR